jgi:hypothetical protein
MFFLLCLVLLRVLLRRQSLAALAFGLFAMLLVGMESNIGWFGYVHGAVWATVVVVVMVRFGLLAFIVGFFLNYYIQGLPIELNPSHWWFTSSCFALALCMAVMIYGLWAALAGRALLKDELARS